MESDRLDPESAIAAIRGAQTEMSRRVGWPLWFHIGLGLLVAQQVLVAGGPGGNWTSASFAALVVGAGVLVMLARRSTGATVASPRGVRSRGVMTARFVVASACIWGAVLLGDIAVVVLLAVAAFAATVILGMVYDDALRDDLANLAARR